MQTTMDLAGRMKLGEILSMQATRAHVAQTRALYFADEVYTYAELEAACAGAARELHLLALHTGDAVALALPNVPAFFAYPVRHPEDRRDRRAVEPGFDLA